jgi:hypothetical protein
MKSFRMDAQATIDDGTITDEMSADGSSMTGTYLFTDWLFDRGNPGGPLRGYPDNPQGAHAQAASDHLFKSGFIIPSDAR